MVSNVFKSREIISNVLQELKPERLTDFRELIEKPELKAYVKLLEPVNKRVTLLEVSFYFNIKV